MFGRIKSFLSSALETAKAVLVTALNVVLEVGVILTLWTVGVGTIVAAVAAVVSFAVTVWPIAVWTVKAVLVLLAIGAALHFLEDEEEEPTSTFDYAEA